MGTTVSIDVRPPVPPSGAVDNIVRWLHHVDDTFSTYRDGSEITAVGRGAPASPEVAAVLADCTELARLTGGAFDVTRVPAPNGTSLDPSGYVKGWSIERAAAMLGSSGAVNACINAGGDVVVRGEPRPGEPWRVGVRHPDSASRLAAVVEVRGAMAVATSGTYERGAHIVDPRTGLAVTDIASATVAGPDLGRADAFATAAFVIGLDAVAWIEGQDGYTCLLITHDGDVVSSAGFPLAR